MLEPVHVLAMDRATQRQEVVRINPTQSFGMKTPAGMALYTWQNGTWYSGGGQEIDPAEVPQEFRDMIAENPPRVTLRGPMVVSTCEFCREKMNSSEMEAHLLAHLRKATGLSVLPPLEETNRPPEEPPTSPTTTRPR